MNLHVRKHALPAILIVFAAVLLLGACGGDDDDTAGEPLVRLMIPGGIDPDEPGEPLIVELPSGNERRIDTEGLLGGVAWALGGERLLAIAIDTESEDVRYLILDHAGETVAEYPYVLDIEQPMLWPSWSPDGEVVAFSGEEIVLLDAEGEVVTTSDLPERGGSGMASRWSPDSQRLLIPALSELLVVGRDGSEQRIPLPRLSDAETARFDLIEWDGDVVTLHGQFPPEEGDEEIVLRVLEVDLESETVIDEYEETFDERSAALVEQYGFSQEHSQELEEAIAGLAPDGLISVAAGQINESEGRWEAFAETRQAPSSATIVVVWKDIAATYELTEGEISSRLGQTAAVGVPGQ